jgi:hypothetical protein
MGIDWVAVINLGGPTAVVLVAWFKGLWISSREHNAIVKIYADRLLEETARAVKAEGERDEMRTLLFEALGINGAMIKKLPILPAPPGAIEIA